MRGDYKRYFYNSSLKHIARYVTIPVIMIAIFGSHLANASTTSPLLGELTNIKMLLSQVGPILSSILFITAGIFYAIGQILPPDKRANFHTASINIIIGAVIVGVLSFASTSLATASTHLLSNVTSSQV